MLQQPIHPDPKIAQHILRVREMLARPYLFIHINKCGGTSVAAALEMPKLHSSVQDLIKNFGLNFVASKKSFALIRRPYERMCSMYRYRNKVEGRAQDGQVLELNEWVYRAIKMRDPEVLKAPKMIQTAHDWMVDAQGRNLVDVIVKLEEIDKGWPQIQALTGSSAALQRLNVTAPAPDTSVAGLSAESREIIENFFAVDFDTYGYDRI